MQRQWAYLHGCHQLDRLRPLRGLSLDIVVVNSAVGVASFLPNGRGRRHAVHDELLAVHKK